MFTLGCKFISILHLEPKPCIMKNIFYFLFFTFSINSLAQDSISKKTINQAALLFDVSFTEPELDSMFNGVKDNAQLYKKMHTLSINNSVPMSLWQSPLLPGMKFETKQLPINWNISTNISIPKNKNDLAFYSILQLASLIKNKKISSVELTQFFISRLKKYSDTLQCVISLTEDIAMQQAKFADAEIAKGKYRGPLHGIPYGLKDLFSVKGTKTTWGAEPYKNQVIDEDAFVYTKLKEAGAVLVAKFTLGALAMGDYWFGGRTKNPWNLLYGSSGSSAGSTSATVAGLVPFAIGTETLGSIISPSHTCGATGLRPTFGSISRSGAMTLSWSLDKVGPICRSAEDAAVVFNYVHGADDIDRSSVNMPFNYFAKTDIKKLKIAYAKNYFNKTDTSRNEWKVLEAFKKMGIIVEAVDFPDSGYYNANIVRPIINAESAAAFDEFTRTNLDDMMTRQTRNDWPNSFRTSRMIPAVEYINANRLRYTLMQKVNDVVSKYDAIICPTRGASGNQLSITNLTGHPAICLPTGFEGRQHLPSSITLVGKLYGEANLLFIAKSLQDATSWDDLHPEMFK